MKTVILALVTLTTALPAFAEEAHFSCTNQVFRDASFGFGPYHVAIQDSILDKDKIAKIAQDKLQTPYTVWVDTVNLIAFRDQGLRCAANSFLVKCQGATNQAELELSGIILGNAFRGGEFKIRIPVNVVDFNLATILRKQGPIRLGEKGVEIKVDQMIVKSTAKLEANGEQLDLEFDTPFFLGDSEENSACKKL